MAFGIEEGVGVEESKLLSGGLLPGDISRSNPVFPGLGRITSSMVKELLKKVKLPKKPLLAPVAPPRGATIRSSGPFDFFGTLFTTPATSGLNPINTLNQTVV